MSIPQVNLTSAKSAFSNIFSSKITPQQQRTLLGVASAGNLVLGEGGLFNTALSIAGIASIFFPVLMLPVALCFLGKSAVSLAKGIGCLFKMDFGGFLSNTIAGALNAVCALPIGRLGNLKGIFEGLKAGRVTMPEFLALSVKECYGREAARQFCHVARATSSKEAASQAFDRMLERGVRTYDGMRQRVAAAAQRAREVSRAA